MNTAKMQPSPIPSEIVHAPEIVEMPRKPAPASSNAFKLKGKLVSAGFGYPLGGLCVQALFVDPAAAVPPARVQSPPQETILGAGESGQGGEFQITFLETPSIEQKLCLLRNSAQATLVLKVYAPIPAADALPARKKTAPRPCLATQKFQSPLRGSITIEVPIKSKSIPPARWKEFAARLKQTRLSSLHTIAGQLLAARGGSSLFSDWDLETRLSLLAALETAFLDPGGELQKAGFTPSFYTFANSARLVDNEMRLQKTSEQIRRVYANSASRASSHAGILDVEIKLDWEDLASGNPGRAVNKHGFEIEDGLKPIELPPVQGEAPESLIPYRDYLLSIFTAESDSGIAAAFDENWIIENRYHQDFRTTDLGLVPANGLLIPIVRDILVAKTGSGYGFGIAAGSLPTRADMSDREYLDALIKLSGLSPNEFGLRYRLNLARPESALSCPVSENIATLQGFYRDGFQDLLEPAPIYPSDKRDRAPFFLHYDEWLRQTAPFYGENFYNSRHVYLVDDLDDSQRNSLILWTGPLYRKDARWRPAVWLVNFLDLQAKMLEGHKAFDLGQYAIARAMYRQAGLLAEHFILNGLAYEDQPPAGSSPESALVQRLQDLFMQRRNLQIQGAQELNRFDEAFRIRLNLGYPYTVDEWLGIDTNLARLQSSYLHLMVYQIPLCLGDCALAMDDYEEAVRQYANFSPLSLGHASAEDYLGYEEIPLGPAASPHPLHYVQSTKQGFSAINRLFKTGGLVYTVSHDWQARNESGYAYPDSAGHNNISSSMATLLLPNFTHPMEERFHRLRLAGTLLEWADALYRTNQAGNIARARELYKGVFWVHRAKPPVLPAWPNDGGILPAIPLNSNPAIRAQLFWAQRGFYQVEAGLNYYGCSEEIVPALRYSTLKEAAAHFAAAAQAAQQDFIACTANIEKILEQTRRDELVNTNMLHRALYQAQIAGQQTLVARSGVEQAEYQVEAITAALNSKEKEMAEDDNLLHQFSGFCDGFKKALDGLGGAKDAANFPKETAGIAAWGSTSGPMIGFVIFVYAGYSSMSSLCDEANRVRGEWLTLRDKTLPRAQAMVVAKQREVTIANLQGLIAQADADLARSLSAFSQEFQRDRFLNSEFWVKMAGLMKRVMRRYLDLGARYAWLAERALAYEQDRPLQLVRFNYFPAGLQGVSGADLLQADLNELEAARLENLRQTVPVKRVYSLVQDFPLAYGQFKKTGRCTFRTQEQSFQQAYPGVYGYRIKAVSLEAVSAGTSSRPRGLLINQGYSLISRQDGTMHDSLRFPEAAPFSDFRLREDMAVYGLPDEALSNFEGSGIDTFWELEFSPQGNSFGLDKIADILITFDLRANYSAALHKTQLEAQPAEVDRLVLVSGRRFQPEAWKELAESKTASTLSFNLAGMGVPGLGTNTKITGLTWMLPGCASPLVHARLRRGSAQNPLDFDFVDGVAFSKAKWFAQSSMSPTALDALLGKDIEQTLELTLDPANNPGVDFSTITDVVLGVEYTGRY